MAEPHLTIGRYEILREIGRGAMGVVYEAHDPVLDRTVALKVIQPATERDAARVFEERFMAEARIAAKLHHPGIVVVHDVDRDPATGKMFIALELLQGETLAEVSAAGPLDWRTVLRLVAQVARALHHAHTQGVVHRDVKPANVMVLPSGEAKVTDFGIARLESARQRLTTTGEFIGTPLYTAPEQAKTEDVDGRADVFSLASVAYTLLAGRPAFLAPTIPGIVHRVVYEEPEPLSRLVPGLPPDVERVLRRALAKDPAGRYPTAEAFAEDVEDVLVGLAPRHETGEDLVVVAEPSTPRAGADATRSLAPPVRPTRARTTALAVAAGVLCLVALFLWIPRRLPAPSAGSAPGKAATPAPAPKIQAPPAAPAPGPLSALPRPEPGHLRIDFDYPFRRGTLRIFVDGQLALEQRLTGQMRKKALVFKVHEGTFRDELDVSAGLHEVRVEVLWEDNARTERIVGDFRPGATRRLEATLGRIRRDLDLEWK